MKTGLKRLVTVIAAVVMIICAYGCSNDTNANDTSWEYAYLADVSFDAKDGIPPVNDELKQLYKDALRLESDINFNNIGLASKDDSSFITRKSSGEIWYRVADDRFGTYREFEKYFDRLFTEKLAEKKLKIYKDSFKNLGGVLYTLCLGRGSDITYAGHYFTIDSLKENLVSLTAHIYNADDVVTSNPVYEKQNDESSYTIRKVAVEFIKNDDLWKLSKFDLFY